MGKNGREIRVCRQKEQVTGFLAAVNSPAGADSLHLGSVTCVTGIQELCRFCLVPREQFVFEVQVQITLTLAMGT